MALDFIFDLAECPGMDSTFLGVLTGLVIKAPGGPAMDVELRKSTTRVRDILDNMGVAERFKFSDEAAWHVGPAPVPVEQFFWPEHVASLPYFRATPLNYTNSLTGLLGIATRALSDATSQDAVFWSAGGGVLAPIFYGGRLRKNYQATLARNNAAAALYLKAAMNAFRETADALVDVQKFQGKGFVALGQGAIARDVREHDGGQPPLVFAHRHPPARTTSVKSAR